MKVSIVGLGMRSHAGIAAKMFRIMAAEGINIQAISTSEIKVSCLIHAKYTELAVRALHDGFGLVAGQARSARQVAARTGSGPVRACGSRGCRRTRPSRSPPPSARGGEMLPLAIIIGATDAGPLGIDLGARSRRQIDRRDAVASVDEDEVAVLREREAGGAVDRGRKRPGRKALRSHERSRAHGRDRSSP